MSAGFYDLFGVAVGAASGVFAAHQQRFDGVGILVLATVTAVGGGTLRDLLLGVPVFWVAEPVLLWMIVAASIVTVAIQRGWHLVRQPLLVADAFALAAFCVAGTEKAVAHGAPSIVAAMMGVMTGVVGGMLRDVLCAQQPLVFRNGEALYATPALLGAVTYLSLTGTGAGGALAAPAGMAAALLLRLAAIRWNLTLPSVWLGR